MAGGGLLQNTGQLQKAGQLQTTDNKPNSMKTRKFGKAQFLNAFLRLLPLLAKLGHSRQYERQLEK